MAVGLPIISTRVGAIPEYIVENKNGLLFEPGDSKTLANHILELMENENKRFHFGKNNLVKVKNYDWKIIAEKYYSLYKEILE